MRRVLPPVLWYGVILALSTDALSAHVTGGLVARLLAVLLPGLGAETLATLHFALRKGAHVVEYAVLALLVQRATGGAAAPAFALALLGAAVDEAHQATTATRVGSPVDVAIDAVGAAAGLAAAAAIRRWRSSAMTRAAIFRAFAALLAVALVGCASAPPYRLDLRYEPADGAAPVPGASAIVVGLAPARDARGLTDAAAIGRRVTAQNEVEPIMPAGPRAERVVTEALRTALVQAGFPVRPVAAWDLRAETLDPAWGNAVIGTEVLEFWTEARSEPLRPTRITSRARIRLVLGDPQARRVVWTNTVESGSEQEVARFTTRTAEANANEALGGVLRSLVESRDLRERLTALR